MRNTFCADKCYHFSAQRIYSFSREMIAEYEKRFCRHSINVLLSTKVPFCCKSAMQTMQVEINAKVLLVSIDYKEPFIFLDTHVSLAPTHLRCPLVRNTFEFPFSQRLWLLFMKSWRERTPIIFRCAVYFLKAYFPKVYFLKVYFPKVYFFESVFF